MLWNKLDLHEVTGGTYEGSNTDLILTGLLDLLERKLSSLAIHMTHDGMADYRSVLETLEAVNKRIDPPEPQPEARPGVLFVDDEEMIRRIGTRVLENAGYSVFTAADGVQTYHELRALSPEIPVIMTTGYGEGEIKGKLEKLDLAGFLRKPFTASALSGLVLECVGKGSKQRTRGNMVGRPATGDRALPPKSPIK